MRAIETEILFCNALQSPLGNVTQVGFIKESGGVSDDPMRILGSYAFVYLLEGSGLYQDEYGVRQNVKSGDLILVSPDIAHAYGPCDGEIWNEMHAVFSGPVFDLWCCSGLWDELAPIVHLQPIEFWFKRLETFFAEFRQASEKSESDAALQLICLLQQIFADALMQSRSPQKIGANDAQWLARAREKLTSSTRNGETKTLESVAQEMGVSYENFRKKFAALSGVAPLKYRMAQQMDRACALLYETDLRHKEIARELGFCDEYHFSRQFKKTVGCSPQQFRKRLPETN